MGSDGIEGLQVGMMSSGWSVVKFVQDLLSKCWVVGNADSIPEIPDVVVTVLQVRRSLVVVGIVEAVVGVGGFDVIQERVGEGHVGW